ncbi:8286_t:CDS:2 [Entrophospora sp. SA101]|nr:8286_t:CDS:2 [Entrophospora sp. SA101]
MCSDASLNMPRPEILANAINQVNNNKGKTPMCYYQYNEYLVVENQEDEVEVQDINFRRGTSETDTIESEILTFDYGSIEQQIRQECDVKVYVKLKLLGSRNNRCFFKSDLTEDRLEDLLPIVNDEDKARQIIDAAHSSMGTDIAELDMVNICHFADCIIDLVEYRKHLSEYLLDRMNNVAPNLSALIGEVVGARLISHAGSLTNLSKYPASTVQILGAEKALFRALKTKGNTPKYGLLFHSSFIGRAGAKNKGRISRFLANKCSIASRIDCFSEKTTATFGEALKNQVEERLKFYEDKQQQ